MDVALDHLDWDYRVVAPITPCGVAVIGDVTRYASAGRARVASVETIDGGVRLVVRGAGERVAITGWCDGEVGATAWTPSGGPSPVDVRRDGDVWQADVDVPATGWLRFDVRPTR